MSKGMPSETELVSLLAGTILTSASIFGRLRAVSSSYDRQRDLYEHSLADAFRAEDVDSALRELHANIFNAWISMSMKLQTADLRIYLARLSDRKSILAGLPEIGARLVPPNATEAEKAVFLQDLSWIRVILLRSEDDWAPGARLGF
jgi:hypothetical protein